MKRYRKEAEFLEELERLPNVTVACETVGLSRNTIYRWCKEDPAFKARLDEALELGIYRVSDIAESRLIAKIDKGDMRAITYWLDNNKKNYIRPRPKSVIENVLDNERVEKIIIETAKMDTPTDESHASSV